MRYTENEESLWRRLVWATCMQNLTRKKWNRMIKQMNVSKEVGKGKTRKHREREKKMEREIEREGERGRERERLREKKKKKRERERIGKAMGGFEDSWFHKVGGQGKCQLYHSMSIVSKVL